MYIKMYKFNIKCNDDLNNNTLHDKSGINNYSRKFFIPFKNQQRNILFKVFIPKRSNPILTELLMKTLFRRSK